MLTRRLYLIKINQPWFLVETHQNTYNLRVNISHWAQRITDFGEVQSTGQHIPMNTTFNWFWWGTTFGSTYPKWTQCWAMCMFCRSLFVLLCFFLCPLCCLFFFDIRILITPLLSSNSSCTSRKSIKHCVHWDVLSDPNVVPQQNQLNNIFVHWDTLTRRLYINKMSPHITYITNDTTEHL
jgi:hypothetical protein